MARYYRRAPRGSRRAKQGVRIDPQNFGLREAIAEWRNDVREGARKAQKRRRRWRPSLRTAVLTDVHLGRHGWRVGQDFRRSPGPA
jgi:hypothetical protein